MNRKTVVLAAFLACTCAPAHAIIFDTAINGLQYAQQQAYQAFMKLKIIEEIRLLKENYDASVRYYAYFKELNSGKGLVQNVAAMLKARTDQMAGELEANIDHDFIHTYADTSIDQFFRTVDRKIDSSMKYAGDELGNAIANRHVGVQIAQQANGLSPKDAANLQVKAAGLQLQMMTQLHEDNLRLIELNSMRLGIEARQQKDEQSLIDGIRASIQKRAPGALPNPAPGATQ